jgi:hypothetical protein
MANREKSIAMYNKLVTFLYEIDNRFMEDNYPKELREFITAGNKLRNTIEKNI